MAPKSRKYQSTPCTVCPMGKCGCLSPCGTQPPPYLGGGEHSGAREHTFLCFCSPVTPGVPNPENRSCAPSPPGRPPPPPYTAHTIYIYLMSYCKAQNMLNLFVLLPFIYGVPLKQLYMFCNIQIDKFYPLLLLL